MVGERYLRIRSKKAVFDALAQERSLYGIVLGKIQYFDVGVYEMQELEVWRIHELLKHDEILIVEYIGL